MEKQVPLGQQERLDQEDHVVRQDLQGQQDQLEHKGKQDQQVQQELWDQQVQLEIEDNLAHLDQPDQLGQLVVQDLVVKEEKLVPQVPKDQQDQQVCNLLFKYP